VWAKKGSGCEDDAPRRRMVASFFHRPREASKSTNQSHKNDIRCVANHESSKRNKPGKAFSYLIKNGAAMPTQERRAERTGLLQHDFTNGVTVMFI
jgi:hypothetical protein